MLVSFGPQLPRLCRVASVRRGFSGREKFHEIREMHLLASEEAEERDMVKEPQLDA